MNEIEKIRAMSAKRKRQVAADAGIKVGYLYQLLYRHKMASPQTAKRIVAAAPELTLNDLRPDIWD